MSAVCPSCGAVKPSSEFYADRSKSNGRRFVCKACDLERSKAYYREHREEKLAKVKAHQRRRTRLSDLADRRADEPPRHSREW